MDKIDYKKLVYYSTKSEPHIIEMPKVNYLAVRGKGDPNDPDGEYVRSISLLYPVIYAIKMSPRNNHHINGYHDFTVPPLEGFWWQNGIKGVDITKKELFEFISVIRLPDFVSKDDFKWAVEFAQRKGNDFSKVEFFEYDEGLCCQMLHLGPYDDEIHTVNKMNLFISENGYEVDFDKRMHHEIYLSDPRRSQASKLKTIIRHPIK